MAWFGAVRVDVDDNKGEVQLMQWFLVGVEVLIGAVLWCVPQLSRRTVPLGVNVPSGHVDDPVVHAAIQRFRLAVVVLTLGSAILALLLGSREQWAGALPLVPVVGGGVAFVLARRPVVQAKAREGWYHAVPVRLQASISNDPAEPSSASSVGWWSGGLGLILLAAAIVIGAVRWGSIPSPYPTHFDGAGRPDRFGAKTVVNVFGMPIVGIVLVVLLVGLSWAVTRTPLRQYADGAPALAAQRARRERRAVVVILGVVSLLLSLTFAVLSVVVYLNASQGVRRASLVGTLVLDALVVLGTLVVAFRVRSRSDDVAWQHRDDGPAGGTAGGAESPDDDRYWKGA